MLKISVIICTHNPREDYLKRVLDALRAQTLPLTDWELLLVDNASKKPLAGRVDLSWHPNARHVREERVGKTYALLRAITEFQGELFVIVDDDNVLRNDYLEACLKISVDYPQLGAWSGSCIPEFEIEPPAELRPWMDGLVIEKLTAPLWAKLQRCTEACPMGAGMAVRRNVVSHYQNLVLNDPLRQTFGPGGKFPGAGDDTDMALCGFELGLGGGRFPELELTHLIPARKLTLEYLEHLYRGSGYSGVILEAIHKRMFFPGQMAAGPQRILLLQIVMLFTGKNHVERRIRLARERGAAQAVRDLKRLNRQPSSAG